MDALTLRPLRLLATVFALALGLALVAAAPATAQLPEELDDLGGEEEPGDGEEPDGEEPDFGLDDEEDPEGTEDDEFGDGFDDDGDEFGDDDAQVTQTPEGGVAAGLGGMSGPPAAALVALALTLTLIGVAAFAVQRRPALLPWSERS